MLLTVISVIYGAGTLVVLALVAAKNRAADPALKVYEDREQMRTLRRRAQRHHEEVFKTTP